MGDKSHLCSNIPAGSALLISTMSTNYPHTGVIMETSTATFLYCKHLQKKCKVCGGMADAASWRFCQWDGHSTYHKVYIEYFHRGRSMCQESSAGWYPRRELKDIVDFLGFVKVDRMIFSTEMISWPHDGLMPQRSSRGHNFDGLVPCGVSEWCHP